ncbi:hypothetical protein [Enterococcus sp. DIV0800]|uniref:hypothetical protein n=1 Tax=unclassified Enterococcus TaxID=2608891 RepID=UPI003D301534
MTQNSMSDRQFIDLAKKVKEAGKDETPYLNIEEKTAIVIGDANKTEVKKNDYTIKFRMPMSMFTERPEGGEPVGKGAYWLITKTFEEISITPRKDLILSDAIMKLVPFFHDLKEDGSMEEYSDAELFSIFAMAGDEIHLAMYNIAATFLGVDDVLAEYMLPGYVIGCVAELVENHPEIFNEAGDFFG